MKKSILGQFYQTFRSKEEKKERTYATAAKIPRASNYCRSKEKRDELMEPSVYRYREFLFASPVRIIVVR